MRFIVKVLVAVVILIGVAIAAFFLVPADKIAGIVEDRFEAATGRALTVKGDVRPTLIPQLGVKSENITIANAAWSDKGPMLQAEGLAVTVDWSALFGGDIRIIGVDVQSPEVLLEVGPDGAGNWELAGSGGDSSGESAGGIPAFSLDQATLSNASIRYIDAAGVETALSGMDATLQLPDFAGTANLTLEGAFNGQPLSVNAEIAQFADFLNSGAVPIVLTASLAGSDVGLNGRAGLTPLALDGQVRAKISDKGPLFAALGQSAPELPRGLGQSGIDFASDVTFTDAGLNLRDLALTLDQNSFAGAADVVFREDRPQIKAQITTGALDLSGLSDGDAAPSKTAGWSNDPIDVSGLGAIDGNISFAADSIALGDSTLGRTVLATAIDNSRMVTEIKQLSAYDGNIAGGFVVNGRSGLSASADLSGSAIAISRLFSELFGYDRLITLGDMSLKVLASGNSMDALLNSMDGDGSFNLGAGELLGFDFVAMLRNLDPGFTGENDKTIFDSVSGTFKIVDGVVINDNLSFLSPFLTASGSGTVGLGGQTMDYRLVPKLLEGTDKGISVPILITGSWADPKIRLDLKSLVDEKVDVKVEEVRDQVEQKVEDKVAEELGVTRQDGQSAKDAVKDKLEDRAKEGLLNLLGRD